LKQISKKFILFILVLQLGIYSCKSEEKQSEKTSNEINKTENIKVTESEEKADIKNLESTKEEIENIIKLNDKEFKNSGLKIVNVEKRILPDYLKASGEIEEDENFITHINSKLAGKVSATYKNVGEYVKKGEIIATIESEEIASLQSELLENISKIGFSKIEISNRSKINDSLITQQEKYIDFLEQNYNRQKELYNDDIAPRKNVEEADKNLKTAILEKEKIKIEGKTEIQKLQNEINNLNLKTEFIIKKLQLINFNSSDINELIKTRKIKTSVSIISPVDGLISYKHMSLGEVIDQDKDIFTITDPACIWVYANIYEKDISKIVIGQKGYLKTNSYPNVKYYVTVNYILPQVENETRVSKVRLAVKKNQPILKKGMFTDIFIDIGKGSSILVIPREAIQRENNNPVVYVPKSKDTFESRFVNVGRTLDKYVEITKGLKPNEKVVSEGSFTLKSISRKSEMGEE